MRHILSLIIIVSSLTCLRIGYAGASSIDFDSLSHGDIVNTQFLASHGVTISADNARPGGPDLAAIFDSQGRTGPGDLRGPMVSHWKKGNLAPDTVLGNLLIIPRKFRDKDGDGRIDHPRDETHRPAGSIFFDFNDPITSFGFDLIDVDGPKEFSQNHHHHHNEHHHHEHGHDDDDGDDDDDDHEGDDGRDGDDRHHDGHHGGGHGDDDFRPTRGFFSVFLDDNELARVGFGDFIDPLSTFYDPTVEYGNHSANRITPITATQLGLSAFDRVRINMGGSGAIDNINWEFAYLPPPSTAPIPEPSTLFLVGSGLAGIYIRRKKMYGRV